MDSNWQYQNGNSKVTVSDSVHLYKSRILYVVCEIGSSENLITSQIQEACNLLELMADSAHWIHLTTSQSGIGRGTSADAEMTVIISGINSCYVWWQWNELMKVRSSQWIEKCYVRSIISTKQSNAKEE